LAYRLADLGRLETESAWNSADQVASLGRLLFHCRWSEVLEEYLLADLGCLEAKLAWFHQSVCLGCLAGSLANLACSVHHCHLLAVLECQEHLSAVPGCQELQLGMRHPSAVLGCLAGP